MKATIAFVLCAALLFGATNAAQLWYLNPSGPTDRASVGVVSLDSSVSTASLKQQYSVDAPAANSQCHGLLVTDTTIYIGFSNGYDIKGPFYFLCSIDRASGRVNRSSTAFVPSQPRRFYESTDGRLVVAYPLKKYGYDELAYVDVSCERVFPIGRFSYATDSSGSSTSGGVFSVNQAAPVDPTRDIAYLSYLGSAANVTTLDGGTLRVVPSPRFALSSAFVSLGGSQWHTTIRYADVRYSYGFGQLAVDDASVSAAPEAARQQSGFVPVLAGIAATKTSVAQLYESTSFFGGPQPFLATYAPSSNASVRYNLVADTIYSAGWGMNLFYH
jgi:hypothetical protein